MDAMIPQRAAQGPLEALTAAQTGVAVVALALSMAAVVTGGGGSVPGWLGLLVVVLTGVISGFSVRWFRRRPIEVGDWHAYRQTSLVRFLIAADTAVVGAVMTFVGASVWPAVVGGMISIINLALAPVSEDDYIRHQIIYIEDNVEVPEEKWGEADPKAVTPWEDLEEGHGHGLSH